MGTWVFFWKRFKPWFSVSMCVIVGVIPAMEAYLFGKIADGIGPTGSLVSLGNYMSLLFLLHIIRDYAQHQLNFEIPIGVVRTQLRCHLHAQFLEMKGELAAAWSPGRAVAMMDRDVFEMVAYVWGAVFSL